MVEFREIVINGLLIGLFIFSITSFGIYLADDNSVNNTILENEAFNNTFGDLGGELSDVQTTSQSQSNVQDVDVPTEESESLPLKSAPKMATAFKSMWRNIYELTIGLISSVFGISPIVTGTITAILLITMILLTWSLIKTGR